VRAARVTARVHQRGAAATWDVFRPLPLADAGVDVLLDVFAPRNPAEFRRVLRPSGRLVVVRPTARHLRELQCQVPGMVTVDPAKEARLHDALAPFFEAADSRLVEYVAPVSTAEARDLVLMTPSARHRQASASAHELGARRITVSVLTTAFRAR
jgi:23S rRNA (guanine745-N1)-methyltransferase